jgi:hypothetical protein
LDELKEMYKHRDIIGGFGEQAYWSSTEYDGFNAYRIYFDKNTPIV